MTHTVTMTAAEIAATGRLVGLAVDQRAETLGARVLHEYPDAALDWAADET